MSLVKMLHSPTYEGDEGGSEGGLLAVASWRGIEDRDCLKRGGREGKRGRLFPTFFCQEKREGERRGCGA